MLACTGAWGNLDMAPPAATAGFVIPADCGTKYLLGLCCAQAEETLLPSKPHAAQREAGSAAAEGGQSNSGWAVLQDGLVGAKGTGTRLKDWDQMADSSEEGDADGMGADVDDDSESD